MRTRAAVVVIDLQNSQLGRNLGPHSVDTVVSNANRLIRAGRAHDALIVYAVSSHLPSGGDALSVVADDRPAAPHRRPEGWDRLLDGVDAPRAETDPVTTKRGWDAFYGSSLELQLRRHGVTEVVLTGISTNFGVEGTARAAIDRGFRVIFAEDAMTSANAELHEFAVTRILPRIGRVVSTSATLDLLRERAEVAI